MAKATFAGRPRERKIGTRKWRDLVDRSKQLLKIAREYRQTERERFWRRSERQYFGQHWFSVVGDYGKFADVVDDASSPSIDLISVNYSFSTIQTIVPFVAGHSPTFRVEPYSQEATIANARQQAAMLNRIWRSQQFAGDATLKRAAFDYLLYGDAWMLPTYEVEIVEERESAISSSSVAILGLDHISPWDIWVDPMADGAFNARWVIRRMITSVEDLQEDKRYKNTSGLEANLATSNQDDEENRAERTYTTSHARDKLIEVFEFYDIVAKQVITFVDQKDVPLRVVEDQEFPLVPMKNYHIPNTPYGMGELEQVWVLQQEMNKTRSQLSSHRRRNVQKYVARKGILDDDAKDALKSQEVNAVAEIDSDEPIENLVKPMLIPSLTADIYNNYSITREDLFEITGISEYQRGGTPEGRRTATEATILESAANIKTSHKLRAIEEAARLSGTLLLAYAKEVFPTTDVKEQTMVITGREAQSVQQAQNIGLAPEDDEFIPPTEIASLGIEPDEAMFAGEYEVFVDQGTTELRDPIARAQKFRGMFADLLTAAPTLLQLGVNVNIRKVLEMWFEAEGIDDIDGMFEGQQPQQGGEIPPEILEQILGGQGGGQQAGVPNADGALPPEAAITPESSGMLSPVGLDAQA